ncbi:MAG: 5-(carboxyamino)imidazole ribonucleotide mutase [Candidatus Hydrothermarchaeota archaeon]|nr:MAG: 5-(carboxyamino)imidazole ribonucleotide mutase [Candidatus Hydrothermarchaeota archaeon]
MSEVAIIAGSRSDEPLVKKVEEVLGEHDITYETYYASAHREPEKVKEIVQSTKAKVFIAIAGLSAALPGFIASYTEKPVIGLPREVKLLGLDALLAMAQLPPGVPVAVVGIDNAKNAALLAIRMLKLSKSEK